MAKTTEDKKESPTKIRRKAFGYNKMILSNLGKYTQTIELDRESLNKDVTLHYSGTNYIWLSHDCYKASKKNKGKSELRLQELGMSGSKGELMVGELGKIWLIFKCEKCSFKARLQVCLWGKKLKVERG